MFAEVVEAVCDSAKQLGTAKKIRKCAKASYEKALKTFPVDKAAEKKRKEKEKEETAASKAQLRKYAQRCGDANSSLQGALPPLGRAWPDDANGRWRLSYRNESRSISWTAAGANAAAACAIKQMWHWSERYGDGDMPEAVSKTVLGLERGRA